MCRNYVSRVKRFVVAGTKYTFETAKYPTHVLKFPLPFVFEQIIFFPSPMLNVLLVLKHIQKGLRPTLMGRKPPNTSGDLVNIKTNTI